MATKAKTPPKPAHLSHDEAGLERLILFSDAVFAIAITLLALEIRLPGDVAEMTNQVLLNSLLSIWPKYLGYLISFLVIGSFWIGHHRRFQFIVRYDNRLLFLNLLALMVIAFIPFPTAIISESGNRTATIFYAVTIASVGLLYALLWGYASHRNRLTIALDRVQARRSTLNALIIPVIFLMSIGLAFVDPDLAKFSWILVVPAAMLTR